jgi:hypothetical protein
MLAQAQSSGPDRVVIVVVMERGWIIFFKGCVADSNGAPFFVSRIL